MTSSTDQTVAVPSAQALVDLCAGVIPVWARHLANSRTQSEVAVTEMMQAFANIGPHLGRAHQHAQGTERPGGRADGAALSNLAQDCERLLSPLLRTNLPHDSTQAIQNALALVRDAAEALAQPALPVPLESEAVAHEVERMYIGFQYQDRISQMLALLESDIARLQHVLGGKTTEVPALDDWMQRLESQYAMSEQHSIHGGNPASQPASSAGEEATFF